MKIKKGDNVMIVSGKDKGKTGKVLVAFPKQNSVIVEGMNVQKRHEKRKRSDSKGQIIDKAMPINVSNVMISVDGKVARVGKKVIGEKMVRINKKTGREI